MSHDPSLPPAGGYLTLRLDVMNGIAKEMGTHAHESRLGLTLREVRLLLIIREHVGLTMTRLVDLAYMEKTMVSKAVTRLTKLGLVERQIGEADARNVALKLTRKGLSSAEKAGVIANEGIERMLSVLTKHEREVFETALDKMTQLLLADRAALAAGEPIPRKPARKSTAAAEPAGSASSSTTSSTTPKRGRKPAAR